MRRDEGMPKPFNGGASSTSTSSSALFFHPSSNSNSTSSSSSLPPPSVLIYKSLLEEELREARRNDTRFFWGLVSLAASAFAAAARPDLLPAAFLLFAITALPARAVGFARRRWGFFMLDFCYFSNAAVAAWLLFLLQLRGEGTTETKKMSNLKAAIVALAEGPLAAAALAWRCSWCPGMSSSHLISTLVHVLPGAALFAREVTLLSAVAEAGKKHQRRPSFFGGGQAKGAEQQPQQQSFSFLWSLQYQFLVPLLFYLAWQLLYFCVVQLALRDSILKNRHDTSYRCLARRAARADNFWNLLVRGREPCEVTGALKPSPSSQEVDERRGLPRGTTATLRCLRFAAVQLVFTAATLAAAAAVTINAKLWACWQVIKFAAPLWYGVEAVAKGRRKAAERRVERALEAAIAAVNNNKN